MSDFLQTLKSACAHVENGEGLDGTGYLVDGDRVVTCHYVIGRNKKEGDEVTVTFDSGEPTVATVTIIDEPNDIAVLHLARIDSGRVPLKLAPCDDRVSWLSYGYPGIAKGIGLPMDGQVLDPKGRDTLKNPARVLFANMVAAGMGGKMHGFSGSPITAGGYVIGQLKRILSDDENSERSAFGLLFATPTEQILAHLGLPPAATKLKMQGPSEIIIPDELPGADYHAFISYAQADVAKAKELEEELSKADLRVCLDSKQSEPETLLTQELQKAVAHSRTAVILLSKAWLESKSAQAEGGLVLQRRKTDPIFRVVTLLLEALELPEKWSFLSPIDCRDLVEFQGPKREQIIFAVNGQTPPVRLAVAVIADNTDRHTFTGTANKLADCEMAISLISIGQPEAALKFLPADSTDLKVRQLRALALGKDGQLDEALQILEMLTGEGHLDSGETGGLIAGRYRQKWERTGDKRLLNTARITYLEVWESTGRQNAFPGINAASLLLHNSQQDEARVIASEILELLQDCTFTKSTHWDLATIAEAHLILRNFDAARDWYTKAVAKKPDALQDIATMRKSARWDLQALGRQPGEFDDVFSVPVGVVFIGHAVDEPGRPAPRFPQDREREVRMSIRKKLKELSAGFGVCSASPGSDIIFLEEMVVERGAPVRIVLPCRMSVFAREYLDAEWQKRLNRVLAHKFVELIELEEVDPRKLWDKFDQRLQDESDRLKRQLDQNACLLAVWDGTPTNFVGRAFSAWEGPKEEIILT